MADRKDSTRATNSELLADLARVKVLFQLRAIAAVIGARPTHQREETR